MDISVRQTYRKVGRIRFYIIAHSIQAKYFCLVTGADDYRPYCLWMIGIKSYCLTMGIVVKWIAEMCAARVKRGQECHRLIGRAWYIGSLDRTLHERVLWILFKRFKAVEIPRGYAVRIK